MATTPSAVLSILLLKEDAGDPVDDEKVDSEHTMPQLGSNARLVTRQIPARPPRWKSFLKDMPSPALGNMHNSSSSALLLVPAGARTFAVTFGYGRSLLRPSTWEENFGLRVTLNSVEPTKLRSVDVKMLDPLTRHSRTNASQDGELTAFGFNPGQDLLRAVTGKPIDETLGSRMTGMDALSVAARVEIDDLPALLGRYLAQYEKHDYRRRFPQVDSIREVRDKAVVGELDEAIVTAARDGDFDKLWLAVPGVVDWTRIGGFHYRARLDDDRVDDIHWSTFLATVRDRQSLSVAMLKARRVQPVDHDGAPLPDESWRVYDCVYCEVARDGTTYLLTDGRWYALESGYVSTVNGQVARLVSKTSTLPAYNDKSEGTYNKRVAKTIGGHKLMDQVLIPHGGRHGKIEFCDLFKTAGGRMIHVKRYAGSSSTLSHLFAQGVVAATTFLADATFRRKVEAKLGTSASWKLGSRPDPTRLELVYAIVSGSKRPLTDSLPFFSKVALVTAATVLQGAQLNVAVEKIEKK